MRNIDERLEVLDIYSERLLRGQEDKVGLNKTKSAAAVNEVEPDFEADPPSPPQSDRPHQHRPHTHPQVLGSSPQGTLCKLHPDLYNQPVPYTQVMLLNLMPRESP